MPKCLCGPSGAVVAVSRVACVGVLWCGSLEAEAEADLELGA